MKRDENKLNMLLRRFVDEAAAEAMAEDSQKGDALLKRFADPVLSDKAKDRMRARFEAGCSARRRARRLMFGFAGVAAAAVALFVVLFVGNDLGPSPVSSPNREIAMPHTDERLPSPIQPESQPVAATSGEISDEDLKAVARYLWDDGSYADSGDFFTVIREELDNIAAAIEAVRMDSERAAPERFIHGASSDDAQQRARSLITADFWKG